MIPTLDKDDLIVSCDAYLGARTGRYEWRAIRYRAALEHIQPDDTDTIVDVGAGWTEFDYCLRAEFGSRCRYIPVDGCIDGTDLEVWTPPREADWFVALELLEHLHDPDRLVAAMQEKARKGIVISTPNPMTTDVLGMDPTHVTPISAARLAGYGFSSTEESFYGMQRDSLLGLWRNS
jgi:hypothetical protein